MPEAERLTEFKKALQRTFHALRIAVNDEFGVLNRFLMLLPSCLNPGARRDPELSFGRGPAREEVAPVRRAGPHLCPRGTRSDPACGRRAARKSALAQRPNADVEPVNLIAARRPFDEWVCKCER